MAATDLGTISLRELGRATLARQHLLERTDASVIEVMERLVGLQSQIPNPAFTGLWSRIEGFEFADLSAAMLDRSAVRLTLMRVTVHLVSARDALALRPLLQEQFDRSFVPARVRMLDGVDLEAVESFARELIADAPQTTKQLTDALAARWPGHPPAALLTYVRLRLPLLQIPPRGVWGKSFQTTYSLLDDFTGETPQPMSRADLVRRYLASAGPATVKDMQLWSGLPGLQPTFTELGDALVTFRGPEGETFYDLPDAPRPPADTPAPVRILPEWDTLMMFADRRRIVDEDRRKVMLSINGIYSASVIVDGVVVATCKTSKSKAGGRIDVWPFEKLTKTIQADIRREGDALLTAMGKGYAGGDVVIHEAGTGYTKGETVKPTS